MRGADPWLLPAAHQFLAEVEPLVWKGGAIVTSDASTPSGLADRLVSHLRDTVTVERLAPRPGELPLAALGEACGLVGAPMAQLVASGRVLLVEAQHLAPADLARWAHALSDFATSFAKAGEGGAILFLGDARVPGIGQLTWAKRLRRADSMIWAEYAVPSERNDLLQRMAVDLAVELCGWRLDLVADLVSQRDEDILDPLGWLRRRADEAVATTPTFGKGPFACPLDLLNRGNLTELKHRIWKSQLSVLFPWIEGHRQKLIERYRKHLYLDEHLRGLGVVNVEDIELGGLRRQLTRVLVRDQADQVAALANLRNDLAHRKPINVRDFALANQMRWDD